MARYIKLVRRKTSNTIEDMWIRAHWDNIEGRPSEFLPAGHSHKLTELTDVFATGAAGTTIMWSPEANGGLGGWVNQTIPLPYSLPKASSNSRGGIKADTYNSQVDKVEAKIDPVSEKLYVAAPSLTANNSWTGDNTFNYLRTMYSTIQAYHERGAWDSYFLPVSEMGGVLATQNYVNTNSGDLNLPIIYGYSSTGITTTAKVVSASSSSNTFSDYTRNQIYVIEFANGNTATSPTININSKGAKGIRHLAANGAITTSPGTDIFYGRSRMLVAFVYDGEYFIPIGVSTRHSNALETKMVGYTQGSSTAVISASDTVSSALAKLQNQINAAGGGGIEGLFNFYDNEYVSYAWDGSDEVGLRADTNLEMTHESGAFGPIYKIGSPNMNVVYGYSSTAVGTTAKVAGVTSSPHIIDKYRDNQLYVIEFLNGNSVTNPTLNIGSKGAKAIRHLTTNGAVATGSGTTIFNFTGRGIVTFVYREQDDVFIPIGLIKKPEAGGGGAPSNADLVTNDIYLQLARDGYEEFSIPDSTVSMTFTAMSAGITATVITNVMLEYLNDQGYGHPIGGGIYIEEVIRGGGSYYIAVSGSDNASVVYGYYT